RFEKVDDATDAPGPGADRAPFVGFGTGLSRLQRQADNALFPAVGPIGLNIAVSNSRVAPAALQYFGDEIEAAGSGVARKRSAEGDVQQHGHGLSRLGRRVDGEAHLWASGFVPHDARDLAQPRRSVSGLVICFFDLPDHLRSLGGNAAIDLRPIEFEDFRAA